MKVIPWLRLIWLGAAACIATMPGLAEQQPHDAIDELVANLAQDDKLAVDRINVLPTVLHGPLVVVAEFDDDTQAWLPSANPESWGSIGPRRIDFLGHVVGETGFVRAEYLDFKDRQVVSYSGITVDRRLSLNLYDDAGDREHLALQVRVGPRLMRYLVQRPGP